MSTTATSPEPAQPANPRRPYRRPESKFLSLNGEAAAQALKPGDATVAGALKEAGYRTALIGKWGLGDVGTSGRPVVLVHHVDLHRYSAVIPDEKVQHSEWDYGDAHAYYQTLKGYNIAATLCGHTHVRNLMRWNGTNDAKTQEGVPFLNTDNAAHFHSTSQAFLHIEVDARETRVREFATKDAWVTGAWTPQVWTFAHHA